MRSSAASRIGAQDFEATPLAPTTRPAHSKRSWLAEQKMVLMRLQAEQSVLSACKGWLDRLPAGTKLEPVAVTADGRDLDEVRSRIKAANAELDALRRAPAHRKTSRRASGSTSEGSRRRCGAWESVSASALSGPVPRRRVSSYPSTPAIPCHWSPRCFPTGCSASSWLRSSGWPTTRCRLREGRDGSPPLSVT
jgi:hypothetical protein